MTTAVLYSRSNCPRCVVAKIWLLKHNIDVKEIDLDDKPTLDEFKRNYPTIKQAPAVFINDELFTGWFFQ